MKLSRLMKPKEAKIAFGDAPEDVLTVVYRPGVLTPRMLVELEELDEMSAGKQTEAVVALLPRIIVSWDLADDDGTPYPLEPDALMDLPLDVLMTVMQAITDREKPGKGSAGTSSVTS